VTPRPTEYPPHLQRAIDAAEAKRMRGTTETTKTTEGAGSARAQSGKRGTNNSRNIPAPVAASPKPTSRRDTLNKTEAAYLSHLEILKRAGEIVWIGEHESIAFRIADGEGKGKKASYRPDFPVLDRDGRLVLFEVKGHWREAARLRIKVAASTFGFRFVAVQKQGERWSYEEFGFGAQP
jgi:hypothetical protein